MSNKPDQSEDKTPTEPPAGTGAQIPVPPAKPPGQASRNSQHGGESGITDEKEPFNEQFEKVKWIFQNPLKAVILLAMVLIIAFSTGFLSKIAEKGENLFDWVCIAVKWCQAPATSNWEVAFSTAVPHCLTGRLPHELRDWEPPIVWQEGADRMLICADATIEGPKNKIPTLIAQRFPSCLRVAASNAAVTVTANRNSGALCRAPYRFNDTRPVPASLDRGIILCVPGQAFESAGTEIAACGLDILTSFGFGSE